MWCAQADAQGRTTWLLSSNVANMAFYNYLGFHTVGTVYIGLGDPTWTKPPIRVDVVSAALSGLVLYNHFIDAFLYFRCSGSRRARRCRTLNLLSTRHVLGTIYEECRENKKDAIRSHPPAQTYSVLEPFSDFKAG